MYSIILIIFHRADPKLLARITLTVLKCIIAVNCKKNQSIIKKDQTNCFYITILIQYLI
jgi:hypothetical protein